MHELTWRHLDLTVLMAADELGLDLDRLLFARYLLLTGRLSDRQPTQGGEGEWAEVMPSRSRRSPSRGGRQNGDRAS